MYNSSLKYTNPLYKLIVRSGFKPDAGIISAIQSMKQNPKFSRLLGFSMNCLMPHLTPPNPKHRDNVNYLISEGGHNHIIGALTNHVKDDNILFNSTQLLTKMVGKDKFKDEEIARVLVDSGAVSGLVNALNDPSEKSKHTIKAIIELLNTLGANPNLAGKLIDQGVLESTIKTVSMLNLTENVVKKGLEAIQKITSHPQAKSALISRNIVSDIVNLLEKKSYSPVIIHSGLKLLENISRTKEGVEYLKKDGIGMRAMVTLLEKHPEERGILSIGANILGKIATISDLDQSINSLKSEDFKKVNINIAIISALTLVDEMMEQIIKKNVVADMIAIIKKTTQTKSLSSEEQRNLIKHCAIAVGRVAEVNEKQIKDVIDHGGLETLNAAIELKDPDVIASCVNTLSKLSHSDEVLPKLAKAGCVMKVLKAAEGLLSDAKICESTINLLENLAIDDDVIEEIAKNGGLGIVIRMMKENPDNKKIVEQGTRTLGLLAINEDNANDIIKNGIVEFLIEETSKHPEWRKCAFYAVNLIDGLSEMEQVLPDLKKKNGLQAVVSILSGKTFCDKKEETPTENDITKALDDDELIEIEILNPKQEIELKESGLAVLEKLICPEEILSMRKGLENGLMEMLKKPEPKIVQDIEAKIATLGYLCQIPSLGEQILKDDLVLPLVDFSKKVNNLKDFDGKGRVVSEMVKFFNNLSYLNTRESTRELYQKKKLGQSFISFVNDILEKNQEPLQVIQGLKSLKAFLNQKTGDISNAVSKRNSKRLSLLDVAASKENSQMIEKILDGIVGNLKKYPDNEELQLNALEVFNTMSQLSPDLNSSIVKMGGSRYIIGKIEEDLTTKKVGIQCLKVLNNLALGKKDALLLLNNQKAGEAIMGFLSNQRNDLQCSEIAAPVLKLLANAENSEFTKEMENDIKEIVLTIDPELQKSRYNPINACESLEILNNFALLDKTLIPILKNGAIASISHLLKQELKEDEIILAEKGLLSINERLLAGALGTVTQLIGNPEALKSNLYDDILKNDINGSLVKILQSRQNNSQIVQKALSAINKILSNDKTKEDLLGKLEKGNVVDNLIDFLERYPENPQIAKDSNNILFNLTKASPEVAVKLAKQNFVKNLIKETRVHLKDSVNDSESLRLTKQNLQCMTVLAEIGQTAEKLAIEGGVEFALSILKKENQMNPLLSDEDTYYQLNLASNEQELEKKTGVILAKGGDLESLEEKTIPFYACELLSQMVKDKKKAMVFLNEDGLKEVLNTLQSNITDKNLTLKCLEILKKASENEKLAKILEENNGMNAIFMALNQYPTDVEILDLGGDIINNLGADQLLPQVKSQIPKLTDTVLKSTSDQSVEALTKANVYLSNLLSMPPPLSEEGETLSSNLSVIKALEKQLALSLENPELLASNLLLLTRLGNQGELTKEAIRNSSIPKILLKDVIPNEDIMKPEHGKISELALGALEGMIGGQEEYIKMLDPVKGKEIQIMSSEEKRGNLGKGLLETLKGNNYDLLEEVLNIAELKGTTSDKPHSIKTIEKATGLMAKLCENDSSLAAALLNKGGVSKIKNLFEDMAKKKNTSGLRDSPLKKVGKLISALSRSPEGFQAIIKETDLLEKIVEEINSAKITQEMEQDFEGLKTLSESLKALQALLENNFDKTELIENKVPESLINLILRFNQLPISYLQESPFTEQVLQTAYRTVELLAKDPALARVLGKTDGLTVLSAGLHKAAELSRGDLGLKDPGLKPDLSEEIVGSEEGGDRVIENTLGAFVEFSANAKNAEKLELLNSANGGLIASDIKEILSNKAQNPVIVASGLLLLENCFKASNKVDLKEHLAELKEFEGLTQKLLLQYPKIPLISSLAKNISIIAKTQDPEQLVLEEKQAIKQELTKMTEEIIFEAKKQVEEQEKLEALVFETKNLELNQLEGIKTPILEELPIEKKIITVANSSELMNKLDLVSDSLEDFLKKPMNKITKLEESEIGQLVAAIGNFAGGGKVAQLHNMGVTDGLLGLVSSPNISDILKNESLEALSKLSKDPKLVEKMGENDKLASAIAKGLLENSKKKLNALQKGMVKSQLEAAGNLASNEATSQQLRDEGGIRAIIEMMKNNKENSDILIKCSDALTKLAINDDIINEIISLGGLELIEELYKMYPDLLELLRSFSRLVAILAVNEQVKIKLGEGMVIGIIVEGVKLFQDDLILGVNSCLALGNLSYGYQKNSDNVIKTDFISYTHYYVKKMMKEAELIANVCLFFNSLGFKNSVNKKEMGKKGVMDDLQKIFEAYTSERDLKLNTLKQCFKAIGNISLFLENSCKIIAAGFVASACSFIRSNINVTELVKFSLDIFANMASFPEEINDINLKGMTTQGAIETILHCIQENSLDSEVLFSAINALDLFCMNKSIRLTVAEKDGVSIIVKVLKSQDWNKDLVIKCLRILLNVGSAKENIEVLINNKVHQTIVDIMNVQRKEEQIISQCLKITSKMIFDKIKCKIIYSSGFIHTVYDVFDESTTFNDDCVLVLYGILGTLARFCDEASLAICQKGSSSLIQTIYAKIADVKLMKKAAVLMENLLNLHNNSDLITQNKGIEALNLLLEKYQKDEEINLSSFKSLSNIALSNEDYRKMCLELKCIDHIQKIIEYPGIKELIVTEGKLTINNIMASKVEIPPEEDLNLKKIDSKVTKEIRNFLIAGKICRMYKKDGSSKEMHIFMTSDLKELMAKRPKNNSIKQQWRLPIHQIKETIFDYKDKNKYSQSVFAKSGGLFKKKAEQELCFSLIGPISLEGQRVIHIESANLIEKKKWVEAIAAILDDFKKQSQHKN